MPVGALLSAPAVAALLTLNSPSVGAPGALPPAAAEARETAEISVLTYNVRGLPWPLAFGRAQALEQIGRELALMRGQGRQPTIVLIQEGFRGEMAQLVKTSGYRYWAEGPSRQEAAGRTGVTPRAFHPVRYLLAGEGWGKMLGGGLYVLSDLPIVDLRRTAYRYCAGLDCLANKGVMMVRVRLEQAPVEIDVFNTHMNSKHAARVPRARSSAAHNLQTDELLEFVSRSRGVRPMLVGGDFNVKGAPERYDYRADQRPFTVVSEYCGMQLRRCEGQAAPAATRPWLRSQDLQAFANRGPVEIEPEAVTEAFDSPASGGKLSDHVGYVVRYRLAWSPAELARSGDETQTRTLAAR